MHKRGVFGAALSRVQQIVYDRLDRHALEYGRGRVAMGGCTGFKVVHLFEFGVEVECAVWCVVSVGGARSSGPVSGSVVIVGQGVVGGDRVLVCQCREQLVFGAVGQRISTDGRGLHCGVGSGRADRGVQTRAQ